MRKIKSLKDLSSLLKIDYDVVWCVLREIYDAIEDGAGRGEVLALLTEVLEVALEEDDERLVNMVKALVFWVFYSGEPDLLKACEMAYDVGFDNIIVKLHHEPNTTVLNVSLND